MGIRETLNKNQMATAIAVGAVTVIAIFMIIKSLLPERPLPPPTKAFYSDDDGKTFFEDAIGKVVPFLHNGKPAVRAHVYVCEGSKEKFVGYLEQFTPPVHDELERMTADPNIPARNPDRLRLEQQGRMIKKPGEPPKAWVIAQQNRAAAGRVTQVKCPGSEDSWGIEVGPGE